MTRADPKSNPGIEEVVEFCRANIPGFSHANETVFWAVCNHGLVLDRGPDKKITGLVLFRQIENVEQANERWANHPDGKLYWIDEAFSSQKGGLARMILRYLNTQKGKFRARFVGFNKRKNPYTPLRVYPITFFERLLRAGI